MASYLKASIQRSYAESFLADLERNESQYFFFIGKGTQWTAEPTPNTYVDSVRSEYQAMNDIVGYKKLNPQNIIFALPRYEWTSGTVYDQYNDTDALFDDTDPKIFYVVTDENNIYKCLSNNSGAASTEKPAQVLTTPFTTDDGYVWQYLSTVKEGDLPYELTDYIPVDFATVSTDTETQNQYNTQISAINAAITRISTVNSSGASAGVYTNAVTQNLTDGTTPYTLNVTAFDAATNKVTITDAASLARILFTGVNVNNYVGYTLRVDYSEQNATEVNNYAIISGVNSATNSFEFTLQNDVVDFTITPTANGKVASVEVVPYIKIVGNGSGAYAFPTINSSKQISAVTVVDGGRDYSAALVEVASPKSTVTNHPTLTAVLSPKGGHGSNILKELNTKDILVIVKITEDDAAKIIGGGSYRQFGLIKDPILNDGTGVVAGKEDLYYRDITLIRVDGTVSPSDFALGEANLIVGTESYAAAKVVAIKSSANVSPITLKTLNSTGRFITKQDRVNDYSLTLTTDPSTDYQIGETVQQIVPAGTDLGSGISYGFDLTTSGKVITASGAALEVRLTSNGNFVVQPGITLTGLVSGATGYVSAVAPRYGEYVWVTNTVSNSATFLSDTASNQKLYKVVEAGQAYFDLDNTPAYRGVHVLELSTSLSLQTGAMDNTSASLTQNSFSSGDSVYQGVTGTYGHYATGQVYHWEYVNSAYGKLYLTNVVGAFKSVASDGITGSTLGAYIVASVEEPEIDRTSGEILYIDNVRPISRNVGQQEEFRLRLGF
jgi:hypothetical protein